MNRSISILLFFLLSMGIAVNSFGRVEYTTSKAYMALNGQVSDAGEKAPSPVRSRR